MTARERARQAWRRDCLRWRGHVLRGPDRHWCYDWDGLPVSAFTPEYSSCRETHRTWFGRVCNWFYMRWFNWRIP